MKEFNFDDVVEAIFKDKRIYHIPIADVLMVLICTEEILKQEDENVPYDIPTDLQSQLFADIQSELFSVG